MAFLWVWTVWPGLAASKLVLCCMRSFAELAFSGCRGFSRMSFYVLSSVFCLADRTREIVQMGLNTWPYVESGRKRSLSEKGQKVFGSILAGVFFFLLLLALCLRWHCGWVFWDTVTGLRVLSSGEMGGLCDIGQWVIMGMAYNPGIPRR